MHDKLPTLAAFVVLVVVVGWLLDRFLSGSRTTVNRNISEEIKEVVAAHEESDH